MLVSVCVYDNDGGWNAKSCTIRRSKASVAARDLAKQSNLWTAGQCAAFPPRCSSGCFWTRVFTCHLRSWTWRFRRIHAFPVAAGDRNPFQHTYTHVLTARLSRGRRQWPRAALAATRVKGGSRTGHDRRDSIFVVASQAFAQRRISALNFRTTSPRGRCAPSARPGHAYERRCDKLLRCW